MAQGRWRANLRYVVKWSGPTLLSSSMYFPTLQSVNIFHHRTAIFRWSAIYCSIFLALTVLRIEVIGLPPYYDYAIGVWTEAIYLAETGFDYYALRYESGHTMGPEGGPRSYMTSVLPTIAALFLVTTPSPRASFIAYHLFIFASASGALTLLYALLRSTCDRVVATVATLAVASTPVFLVQVDMLGMEMPLIFAALLATLGVVRCHYFLAVSGGMLAFLMKPTGAIISIAILALCAVVWLLHNDARARRQAQGGILLSIGTLGAQLAILRWGDSFQYLIHPPSGPFLTMALYWFPDVVVLLFLGGIVLLVAGAIALYHTTTSLSGSWWQRLRRSLQQFVEQNQALLFYIIVAVGILLSVNVVFFIPRYFALLIPYYYLIVAGISCIHPRVRSAGLGLMVCITIFNLLNWNGYFYVSHLDAQSAIHGPTIGQALARESSHFERSHEYLEEHRSNMLGMQILDELHEDTPIVAGHPYNYFLSLPQLGYVKTPRRGYSALAMQNTQDTFQPVETILMDLPREVIFVRSANGFCMGYASFRPQLPTPQDEIIYDDNLPSPLLIYLRRYNGSDEDIRRELESHFVQRHYKRTGEFLAEQWKRGERRKVISQFTTPPISRYPQLARLPALTAMYHLNQNGPEAWDTFFQFLAQPDLFNYTGIDYLLRLINPWELRSQAGPLSPDRLSGTGVDMHFKQGLDDLAEDRYIEAGWHFLASLLADDNEFSDFLSQLKIGAYALIQGNPDLAIQHLELARQTEPRLAMIHYWLGIAAAQLERLEDAHQHLATAVELEPGNAQFLIDLGVVQARSENWSDAVQQFENALAIDDTNALARHYLNRAMQQIQPATPLPATPTRTNREIRDRNG